jgi:ribosomal protein L6P/L9E
LNKKNITLSVENDNLKVKAPKNCLTDELKNKLIQKEKKYKRKKKRKRQKEERTSVPCPLSWNIYVKKQC